LSDPWGHSRRAPRLRRGPRAHGRRRRGAYAAPGIRGHLARAGPRAAARPSAPGPELRDGGRSGAGPRPLRPRDARLPGVGRRALLGAGQSFAALKQPDFAVIVYKKLLASSGIEAELAEAAKKNLRALGAN